MVHSRGNFASGTPQGSYDVTHTFPVQFNTTGISSGVKVGTIVASTANPVEVEVFYQVVTAFDATTTNVLTAGTTTTATEWIAAGGVNELLAGFYPSAPVSNISFTGRATAGACTATGVAVGTRILSVTGLIAGIGGTITANNGDFSAKFGPSVTTVSEIPQIDTITNGDTAQFLATLQAPSTVNRFRLTANTNVYAKYTQSGTAATAGSALLIVREYAVNTIPIA